MSTRLCISRQCTYGILALCVGVQSGSLLLHGLFKLLTGSSWQTRASMVWMLLIIQSLNLSSPLRVYVLLNVALHVILFYLTSSIACVLSCDLLSLDSVFLIFSFFFSIFLSFSLASSNSSQHYISQPSNTTA